MSLPSACKAKDPTTCPYHGAVIRMHAAQVAGDYDAYFEARTIVEKAERENWVESANPSPVVKKTRKPRVKKTVEPVVPAVDPKIGVDAATLGDENYAFHDRVHIKDLDGNVGIVFDRVRDDMDRHWEPQYIRIQINRVMDDDDREKMASLLGYSYRVGIRGENLGWPETDSPCSFYVFADTIKGRGSDFNAFETSFKESIQDGSPLRKRTNDRAIEGFHDENLKVEMYYDTIDHELSY
jgi:hypothetical protein